MGKKCSENEDFADKKLGYMLKNPSDLMYIKSRNFLKALTLCHSAVPYTDDNNIYRYKVFMCLIVIIYKALS